MKLIINDLPQYGVLIHGQDAFRNIDFSIFKGFRIGKDLEVQFRAELFNLINQVVFSAPNTQVGSPTFGQSLARIMPPVDCSLP
jgi:hypothetical protein